jgi:lysophospholipase L1-like esterase
MIQRLLVLAAALAPLLPLGAQVIDDMEAMRFAVPQDDQKSPRGTATLVPGKEGKAVRFGFADKCQGAFFSRRLQGDASWDRAAGISFWVHGDGSDHLGGIELIHGDDYSRRYAVAFSIRDTGWRKVTVPWRDIIPETAVAPPIDGKAAKPSGFTVLMVGKWWYWKDYAACSFELDRLALEETIDAPPPPPAPAGAPLGRVLEKLRSGKPVTIVTMGDSLTDFAHWANRGTNWPTLLKEKVEAEFHAKVTLVNPALGGTELRQNLILLPRWAETVKPDLVTVNFGGNDWASGMRGPAFRETLLHAIDRIRRLTGADVLILPTIPCIERWETMAELGTAAREAAREKKAGIADTEKAFHAAGDKDMAARLRLFCDDKVHLGAEGHRVVAETVLAAIRSGGQ